MMVWEVKIGLVGCEDYCDSAENKLTVRFGPAAKRENMDFDMGIYMAAHLCRIGASVNISPGTLWNHEDIQAQTFPSFKDEPVFRTHKGGEAGLVSEEGGAFDINLSASGVHRVYTQTEIMKYSTILFRQAFLYTLQTEFHLTI